VGSGALRDGFRNVCGECDEETGGDEGEEGGDHFGVPGVDALSMDAL
jgi:hypothetical protein